MNRPEIKFFGQLMSGAISGTIPALFSVGKVNFYLSAISESL